jgi:hypothetical protein
MLQSFDVSLPQMGFHMHDCRITNAFLSDQTLTLEFEDGIYIFQDKGEWLRVLLNRFFQNSKRM